MRFHHRHIWELRRGWRYFRSVLGWLSLLPELGVDNIVYSRRLWADGLWLSPVCSTPCGPMCQLEVACSHPCLSISLSPVIFLRHFAFSSLEGTFPGRSGASLGGRNHHYGSGWGWVEAEHVGGSVPAIDLGHSAAPGLSDPMPLRVLVNLFSLFCFLNLIIKKINEIKNHTMELARPKDFTTQWASVQLE